MRRRISIALLFHRLLWAILTVAFLCVSGPPVFRGIAANSVGSPESFHSTDGFLRGLTGVPDPSQRIVDMLTNLPMDKRILVFVRERDGTSSFVGMTIAYLAWPRDVQFSLVSGKATDGQLAVVNPASVCGIVFCGVNQPSWIPAGTQIGRNASFVGLRSRAPNE